MRVCIYRWFQVLNERESIERERVGEKWVLWDISVRGCIVFGVSMQKRVCGNFTIHCSHLFCLCVLQICFFI